MKVKFYRIKLVLGLFTFLLYSFYVHADEPSHFALECSDVLLTEMDYPKEIDIPIRLAEDRHKGSHTFIFYDRQEAENANEEGPLIWVGALLHKNDLSKVKLINEVYMYRESTNEEHRFWQANNRVFDFIKKGTHGLERSRDYLTIDRQNLEITILNHNMFKDEDNMSVITEYRSMYTSCRIVSPEEEMILRTKLDEDIIEVESQILEKQRLEDEAAKSKQKI